MVNCPNSTPILHKSDELRYAFCGSPIWLSEDANPSPWTSPNKNTKPIRVGFNLGEIIFSSATNAMEREIKGSMICAGGEIRPYMARPSVIVCATVNAVDCNTIDLSFGLK